MMDCIGTYQVGAYWGLGEYPDFEWTVGDGDMAGDLVFGVPG